MKFFSFASSTNANAGNKENELHGSPIYMAPEILSDQKYSFESDIWALGCILYELCMLRNPFAYVAVCIKPVIPLIFVY